MLLATIVHDIRGPIARIRAVVELLRDELSISLPPCERAGLALEQLALIEHSAMAVDTLLANMLDAARADRS